MDEVVRSSVEETLNGLLDAEADHGQGRCIGAENRRAILPADHPASSGCRTAGLMAHQNAAALLRGCERVVAGAGFEPATFGL